MKNLLVLLLAAPLIFSAARFGDGMVREYRVPLELKLQKHIISVSDAYNVDPALVIAVIEKESGYDAGAVGDSGNSYGLMQINVQSHKERMAQLGVTKILDPYCNVLIGIDYLAELIEQYGDVDMALVAYNAGPVGAYSGWFSVGKYESDYSRDVMEIAERIGGTRSVG